MCKTYVAYILTIMLHICKLHISVTCPEGGQRIFLGGEGGGGGNVSERRGGVGEGILPTLQIQDADISSITLISV